MAGALDRLVHVGIDARTSAREAKLVVITNAVTLLTAAQATALLVLARGLGLSITPWVLGATVAASALVLWLSATRRAVAARWGLNVVGAGSITATSVLIGPSVHGEIYFFIATAASWYVWPSARDALLSSLLFAICLAVVRVLHAEIAPPDPLPPSVLTWMPHVIAGAVMVGLVGFAWWSHAHTERIDRLLEDERQRSDRLLRNVLPAAIAERLKDAPGTIAERFPEATVLFADLVGFTPLTQQLPAERVVAILDELFSVFDDIAEAHGLEKIKTIGDAYMVVGGVPTPRRDHAEAIARMALEMRAAVTRYDLRLRIGIDTGPVIAGVIGKRKFLYDLWGDAVNTASRMEAHGVPDGIHVTEAARALLADAFVLEPRGPIQVKGKGEMQTYMLVSARA